MNFGNWQIFSVMACLWSASRSEAAGISLDSFSEGAFALEFDGPTGQRDSLTTGSTDERYARGNGVKDWSATLNTTTGSLLYEVNLRGAPDGSNWFNLSYSSSGGFFSLLGVEGFSVKLLDTAGSGELEVLYSENSGQNVRLPITGPGELYYPLSNIVSGGSPDALFQVQFRFIAKTADFSITLEEITLVPEPSTVALAGIAAAGLLRRRRRA